MPSTPSYFTLFVGVAVIMTHLRGAESFTLRRIASSSSSSPAGVGDSHVKSTASVGRPERSSSRGHAQIKTMAEGDLMVAAGYEGRRLVQASRATGQRRPHSDGHVPSDLFNFSDQVEAVVSIEIVKQDLPSAAGGIEPKDNDIHADLELRRRKIMPANRVLSLGQQWHLVKEFITSDYYFGELDELARKHFLQKMLKGLISQQSQKNEYHFN